MRRDRAVILFALATIAVLCWAYLAWLATGQSMTTPDDKPHVMSTELTNWSTGDFLFMLLMWSVMMIGMMTPSVAPMILIYARVARQASSRGALAPAGWFASGYFSGWIGFAVLATLLQLALERALLLSPMMGTATPVLGAALLIGAGVYQWTPMKNACLTQCQSPFLFIQRQGGFRAGRGAAAKLGLRHGAYCIGCCWALMALLFVAGVMNLLWIAVLGALVLAEKVVPSQLLPRVTGICLVIAGLGLLVYPA